MVVEGGVVKWRERWCNGRNIMEPCGVTRDPSGCFLIELSHLCVEHSASLLVCIILRDGRI